MRDGLADELGRSGHWREWYDANVERSIKDVSVEKLLQPRVLGLGLFQDGSVGVGVFPGREEVVIGCFGDRAIRV